MAINKVVYGGNTLIDLTGDTVTADKLAVGVTAHDASGAVVTGTMEAGGGDIDADVVGAFKITHTRNGKKMYKDIASVPEEFDCVGAYTTTEQSLTLSINAKSGDTLIAAFAIRHCASDPPAPTGWEALGHYPYPEKDTTSKQSLHIYTKVVGENEGGTISITLSQSDATQRFYAQLINLRDAKIAGSTTEYIDFIRGKALTPFSLAYENTLVFISSSTISSGSSIDNRPYGFHFAGIVHTYRPDIAYGDEANTSRPNAYQSRLMSCYMPLRSVQEHETCTIEYRSTYGGKNVASIIPYIICCQINIIPGDTPRNVYVPFHDVDYPVLVEC